jgi:hypothetical protein
MKASLPILLALGVLFLSPIAAEAGLYGHCENTGDYRPKKGVVKMYTVPVKVEWEHRHHCLPCGRKAPYRVKVITYRDRFTDGSNRTWKCVVWRSETSL